MRLETGTILSRHAAERTLSVGQNASLFSAARGKRFEREAPRLARERQSPDWRSVKRALRKNSAPFVPVNCALFFILQKSADMFHSLKNSFPRSSALST